MSLNLEWTTKNRSEAWELCVRKMDLITVVTEKTKNQQDAGMACKCQKKNMMKKMVMNAID